MAIAATTLTSGSSTANATTYATASISPTAGRVLLVFTSMTGIGTATASTVTGLSGTWTNIGGSYLPTSLGAGSYDCAALYCTNYSGTGTLTIGNTDSATACDWVVIEIDGANTTTPIVSSATKKVDLGSAVSTPTLTLDSPADANNRAFVGFTAVSSSNTIAAPRTNWTELGEAAISTPNISLECQWRSDTFETTAGVTYTGGPFAAAAVAVEVAAVATGTSASAGNAAGTGAAYQPTVATTNNTADVPPLPVIPPGRVSPQGRWTPFVGDPTPAATSNASPTAGLAAGTGQASGAVAAVAANAGAGAAGGATPDQVATLAAWWKADSLALSNGAAVSSWTDSSSGGNTATQATGTAQPSYQTGIVNGKPVVRFDGTTDFLASAASASLTTTTIFAVVKPTDATGTFTIRGASGDGGLQYRIAAGLQELNRQNEANDGSSLTALSTTSFSIISTSFANASGNPAFYRNGTSDLWFGSADSIVTASTTLIGQNGSSAGEFMSGDLAELIVYNSVLSAGDRATVHSYLSDKYGITVSDYVASPVAGVGTALNPTVATINNTADVPPLPVAPPGRISPQGRWAPFVGDPTPASAVSAPADLAAGSGTASDATISIAPVAANAAGTGAANAPTAQPGPIQSVLSSTTSGTTNVASLPSASTAGSIIVVAITDFSNDFGSVADNKGNTYSRISTAQHANASNDFCHLFYAVNTTGGSGHTVTYTMTGTPAATDSNVGVYEWGGLSTTAAPVGQGAAGAAVSSNDPGAITPALAGSLVFAVGCDDFGSSVQPAPAAGYTLLDHQDDSASHERYYAQAARQTTTAATTAAFALAASSNAASIVAVFAPPTADPAPLRVTPPGRLSPAGRWSPFLGDPTPTPTTSAAAELAAGTGQAFDAVVNVGAQAGLAAGAGQAQAPTITVAPVAGNAAGTGAASAAAANVAPSAGNAAGAGTASNATVTVAAAAGNAAGSGYANPVGDSFESYDTATTWAEGSTVGGWYVNFLGGGQAIPVDVAGDRVLQLESATGLSDPGGTETASSLITSTAISRGDLELQARVRTVAQLRTGYSPTNTPNAWEVAWLAWNYTEPISGQRRFYYVALKTIGIELGKVDQGLPGFPGGQRFLFTDSTPFTVGTWYQVRVLQQGARIQVWVDGVSRVDFTDGPGSGGTPAWGSTGEVVFTSGKVGLYHEDARVQFASVLGSSTARVDLLADVPALFAAPPGRVSPRGLWSPFVGDPTPAATSNASPAAGLAAGTGQASDAAVTIAPTAGNAAGTGTAAAATPNVAPAAGNAAGTGAAQSPTLTIAPAASAASGTGTAADATIATTNNTAEVPPLPVAPPGRLSPAGRWAPFLGDPTPTPTVNAAAENAAGSGTAFAAAVSIAASAGNAASTGTANAATVNVKPNAENAAGTGTANAPAPNVAPAAGLAAGTGAANQPTITNASNAAAGNAAGSGAAGAPTPNIAPAAGLAAATGAAYQPTITTSPNIPAGLAAATAAANDPTVTVAPAAGGGSGTGTAYQPTITAAANAGLASGAGTANAATLTIAPAAGAATGSGAAGNTTPNVGPAAAAAAALGTASDVTPSIAATAGNAAGTGIANDASGGAVFDPAPLPVRPPGRVSPRGRWTPFIGTVSVDAAPTAGAAAGVGAANDAAVTIKPVAENAAGTGSANPATVNVAAAAGAASGTGTAQAATPNIKVAAENAAGTGAANQPTAQVAGSTNASAGLATAAGAAGAPTPAAAGATGAATATGTAHQPAITVSATGGNATGAGSAHQPTASVAPAAGVGSGTGAATAASTAVAVFPAAAAAVGATTAPAPSVSATAGAAAGVGVARDAAAANNVLNGQGTATTVTGTGTAHGPRVIVSVSVRAGAARGVGSSGHVRTATGSGGHTVRPGQPGGPSSRPRARATLIRPTPGGGVIITASSQEL